MAAGHRRPLAPRRRDDFRAAQHRHLRYVHGSRSLVCLGVTLPSSEEVELKFSFEDGEALRAWLDETFPIADDDGAWRTHEITDRYFDTPDLALTEASLGARLRTVGSDTTLTVKADIEVNDGLHRRLELEA